MLDKLLNWIERRGGRREIVRDGKPYISRYYVWRSKYLTILIHKIWASDPDDPHCHPWNNASLILCGNYTEHFLNKSKYRVAGDFVYRKSDTFHRLEVHGHDKPTVTMFFTGRRRRPWGFLTKDRGWVAAREYDRQPVDIEGRDFVVEGHLFPRVKWLREKS